MKNVFKNKKGKKEEGEVEEKKKKEGKWRRARQQKLLDRKKTVKENEACVYVSLPLLPLCS